MPQGLSAFTHTRWVSQSQHDKEDRSWPLFTGVRGIEILRSWALPEELCRRAFLRLRTAILTPHLHNLALLHTEDIDERLL